MTEVYIIIAQFGNEFRTESYTRDSLSKIRSVEKTIQKIPDLVLYRIIKGTYIINEQNNKE